MPHSRCCCCCPPPAPNSSTVGVHACRRGSVQPGKKVAIMGAGPIGEWIWGCRDTPLRGRTALVDECLPSRLQASGLALGAARLHCESTVWHAGLVTLLAAKAFGADSVAITDLKQPNLEMAKQARTGASCTAGVLLARLHLRGGRCIPICLHLLAPVPVPLCSQMSWELNSARSLPHWHSPAAGRGRLPADFSVGAARRRGRRAAPHSKHSGWL